MKRLKLKNKVATIEQLRILSDAKETIIGLNVTDKLTKPYVDQYVNVPKDEIKFFLLDIKNMENDGAECLIVY